MKIIYRKALAAAGLASLAWCSAANAQIVGVSTDTSKVVVGTSTINGGPHASGRPGIAVPSTGLSNLVDFQGLQSSVGVDGNAVSTINAPSGIPSDHTNLGVFHFAKVGTANLYFGEWAQTSSVGDGTHTVYYAGDSAGTTVPTSGTATYSVKGVSDYANKGLLTGTFTANFAAATLTGSIANASNGFGVNIGTADIDGANIIGGGDATATQSGVQVASGGQVSGRFYGGNAAALAGVVAFGSRQYDTAFGGTKN